MDKKKVEIDHLKKMGEGNTAEIYELTNSKILKLFRRGIPKQVAEQEYENCKEIREKIAWIPKEYEIADFDGRYGIVYEKVDGEDYLKRMLRSFIHINQLIKTFAEYHARIHVPADENMRTVKEKLEASINRTAYLSQEKKQIIVEYLKHLPEGKVICHFDFHPGNMMLAKQKIYVLDWMTACRGEACADVARTLLILNYGIDEHLSSVQRMTTKLLQHYIAVKYFMEYQKITSCQKQEVEKWVLPIAAARLNDWISEKERKTLMKVIDKKLSSVKFTV